MTRKARRITVYSIAGVLFLSLAVYFLFALRPMLLPFVMGVFMAYLFRPVMNNFKGSALSKYSRTLVLFAAIGVSIYWFGRLVQTSLPTEREKLELLVRLQYRLNQRYIQWMGINKETGRGNFIYNYIGDQLNPIIKKGNDFLALSPEQIHLFLAYRKGYKNEAPVNDVYYDYFLKNLQITEDSKETFLKENTQVVDQKTPLVASENEGLLKTLHDISVWLIFPLTFLFFLFDKGQILGFFMRQIPNRYFELSMTVVHRVDVALGKYIRGTLLECALVGLTLIFGFWICGMGFKMAILIGALGGITNAIPFFGTAMACVFGCSYALIAENVSPLIPFLSADNLMVSVLLVVVIAHLLDNAIYQPLILGGAVNLHPVVVILAVFGGSMLFGLAGMFLAIPTIVIVKVVVETLFTGLKAYRMI